MLDEQQHTRLEELRQREHGQPLTEMERAELEQLLQDVESAEAAYLTPATKRLREEREAVESQNRTLEDLVCRKQKLEQRLREFLADAQAERQMIEEELAAVLAGNPDSDPDP